MLPDGRTQLAALSWKGMHAEATLSDRLPSAVEVRLQRLSIQRWIKAADADSHGAPGDVMSWRVLAPVLADVRATEMMSCLTAKSACCRRTAGERHWW